MATSCFLSLLPYSASARLLLPAPRTPINLPVGPEQPSQSDSASLSAEEAIAAWNSDSVSQEINQCDWGRENSHQQGLLAGAEVVIINLLGDMLHCLGSGWKLNSLSTGSASSVSRRKRRSSGGRQTWAPD